MIWAIGSRTPRRPNPERGREAETETETETEGAAMVKGTGMKVEVRGTEGRITSGSSSSKLDCTGRPERSLAHARMRVCRRKS